MPCWTIEVDEKTDRAVRSHVLSKGGTEADLARFVEQAVQSAVFWETVDSARAYNKDADPTAIEASVDDALDDVRANRS